MNTHKIGVRGNGSVFLASVYMSGKFRVTRSLDGESTGSAIPFVRGLVIRCVRGRFVILSDGNLDTYTRLVPETSTRMEAEAPAVSVLVAREITARIHARQPTGDWRKNLAPMRRLYRRASANEDWQASSQPLHKPSSSGDSWANIVRLHGETVVVSEREYISDGPSDGRVCVYNYSSATEQLGARRMLGARPDSFDDPWRTQELLISVNQSTSTAARSLWVELLRVTIGAP